MSTPSKLGATYLNDQDILSLWRMMMYKSGTNEDDVNRAVKNNPSKIIDFVKELGLLPLFWEFYINKVDAETVYKIYIQKRRNHGKPTN